MQGINTCCAFKDEAKNGKHSKAFIAAGQYGMLYSDFINSLGDIMLEKPSTAVFTLSSSARDNTPHLKFILGNITPYLYLRTC